MQFSPNLLDDLANQILSFQSFKFETFAHAKKRIFINSKPSIEFVFDRLSLCFYSHNLDNECYSYLGKVLTKIFETTKSREDCKCRTEYGILFHFMTLCSDYMNMKISKKERPDFILNAKTKIGIEISELTTPEDSIMHSIFKQNSEPGKSADEIKKVAVSKHGQIATRYNFLNHGDEFAIESQVFNIFEKKMSFAKIILKKYCSYKKMLNLFDEFIILCNAQHTSCITCKNDSDDIVKIINELHPALKRFTLCVLRTDTDFQNAVDKYLFD